MSGKKGREVHLIVCDLSRPVPILRRRERVHGDGEGSEQFDIVKDTDEELKVRDVGSSSSKRPWSRFLSAQLGFLSNTLS